MLRLWWLCPTLVLLFVTKAVTNAAVNASYVGSSRRLPALSATSRGDVQDVIDIMQYIIDRFLDDCGLYVLHDPREDMGEVVMFLGRPVTSLTLKLTPEGGLGLHNQTQIRPYRTCSAYFILSRDVVGLRELVLSPLFEVQLNYLGRYIFVTGDEAEAAKIVLDNPIMSWRPNAVLVRKVNKSEEESLNDRRADYEMWSHHVFRNDVEDVVYLVERWRDGRQQRGFDLFPNKLSNFYGSQLQAVTFEHAPSIVETSESTADGHHYDGIDIRLLYILSEALNFSLKIANPSDGGKWGSPMENGSWSGLTGDLTRRKAHMGVANLFIHIHYLKVVDMTVPYDMEFGCFITPLPAALPQWVALVYPFSKEVWIAGLSFLLVGTLLLYVASQGAQTWLGDETRWATNLYHIVFYGLGIFFGVSMPQGPQSDVTRSYFIMWVWYGLLITVVYKSSLTAFLTIPLVQPPINTLEQLVSSTLPSWGATGLTFKKMLEENPDPMVQQLAERYEPVSSAEEGILLTAQRKYAMMENRQFLEYTIATNYTNKYGEETLHVMKECFLPFRIGMAMPKKAPYKPNFDEVVTKVVEAGLVRKWFSDVLFASRQRGSSEGEGRGTGAITLDNLQGAWLLLGVGLLISMITFLLENIARPRLGGQKEIDLEQ